jgi:hypothetical protein
MHQNIHFFPTYILKNSCPLFLNVTDVVGLVITNDFEYSNVGMS